MQRLHVGIEQFFLAFVLLGEKFLDFRRVDVEQHRQRADIHDVLEQLTLPRIGVGAIADRRERHTDDIDVVAEFRLRQRPRVVVEKITAGLEFFDVRVPRLRIHRHHQIDAAAAAEPAAFGHAHFVPGRQPLNI